VLWSAGMVVLLSGTTGNGCSVCLSGHLQGRQAPAQDELVSPQLLVNHVVLSWSALGAGCASGCLPDPHTCQALCLLWCWL
jgi:hypothetical protein